MQIALHYPNEFLTSISGYIAEDYGFRAIRSLKFYSNKRVYGPYGEETGTSFTIPMVDDGRIVGFFGGCNVYVDAIGAYFGPVPRPYPLNSLGPVQGEGEKWDDKKHMDIRQIEVISSSIVESISVLYDNYGHPLGPFTHGIAAAAEGERHMVSSIHFYTHEFDSSLMLYLNNL